jgi:hypothetical protein
MLKAALNDLLIFFLGYFCALILLVLRFYGESARSRTGFYWFSATSYFFITALLWYLSKNGFIHDAFFYLFGLTGLAFVIYEGYRILYPIAKSNRSETSEPRATCDSSLFFGSGNLCKILIFTVTLAFCISPGSVVLAGEIPAVPGKPQFSDVTTTSVTVTWNANGNPDGTEYELERARADKNWESAGRTFEIIFYDKGLASEREYFYRVRALNSGGLASDFSENASFTTDPPGAPVVTVFSASVLVYGDGAAPPLEFTCDQDAEFKILLGGDGSPGSGVRIDYGDIKAGVIEKITFDRKKDLKPDNAPLDIYVTCFESGNPSIFGFAPNVVYDDHEAPLSSIDYPANGQALPVVSYFSGIATDAGGGDVTLVELSLKDTTDNLYWDNETLDFTSVPAVFFAADDSGNWFFDAGAISFQDSHDYSLLSRATDAGGNVGPLSAGANFSIDANLPSITIEAPDASTACIGPAIDAIIRWKVDRICNYYIRIGGSGDIESGIDYESGFAIADETVETRIPATLFNDNAIQKVYVVAESGVSLLAYDFRIFYDDQTPPTTTLETAFAPVMEPPSLIEGTASDDVSGLASVTLAIRDELDMYYDPASNLFAPAEKYFSVTGMASWSFAAPNIPWSDATAYAIMVKAEDSVGNVEQRELASFRAVTENRFFPDDSGGGGGGGCFLATACYEKCRLKDYRVVANSTGAYLISTADYRKLETLRALRDGVLSKYSIGRAFIRGYYRYSPPVAASIRTKPAAKTLVRWLIVTPAYLVARECMGESYLIRLLGFIILLGALVLIRRRRRNRGVLRPEKVRKDA